MPSRPQPHPSHRPAPVRAAGRDHRGHAPAGPRPRRRGHHPPDRRGRRHRRGHHLPGLPGQGVPHRGGRRVGLRLDRRPTPRSAAIDPTLPLEARLVEAVEILRRRVADLWQLRTALGMMQVSSGGPSMTDKHRPPDLTPLASAVRRRPRPDPARPAGGRAPAARADDRRHPPGADPRRAAVVGRDRLAVPRRDPRAADRR